MNIGERIQELRKKSSMTQEQLAELLRVSPQAISKWERGVANPDLYLIPDIAEIFSVSADYLLRDIVSTRNLYGDKQIASKLEKLTPKQRVVLEAIIDTYVEYID